MADDDRELFFNDNSVMTGFAEPDNERYFEDYVPGSVQEYGPISVEAEETTEFAKQFGPGSWRPEQGSSENGSSQNAIANEWLVVGLMMRLFVQHFLSSVASIASPGVDEMRWEKPVRTGDALRVRVTVIETRRSASKPDRGMVRCFIELFNQHGEVVLTLKSMNLIRSRAVAGASR